MSRNRLGWLGWPVVLILLGMILSIKQVRVAASNITGNICCINGVAFPTSALFVNSNASAQPGALTAAQATAALNPFTSSLQGLVTASGGGTTNFARADGTWAAPPSGSGFTAAPPYLLSGSTYYIAATGFQATRPSGSPTWVNSVTPSTVTAGANGDLLIAGTGVYWATLTATTTVEGVVHFINLTATGVSTTVNGGVWMYDSTNSKIYKWYVAISNVNVATAGSSVLGLDIYTYNGSGNPTYSSTAVIYDFPCGSSPVHLKMSRTSTTLSILASTDGGATYVTFGQTETVGTLAQAGYAIVGNSSMTILSIAVT